MRPIIRVRNVSKQFTLKTGHQSDSFKEVLTKIINSPIRSLRARWETEKIWSLRDISFDVMPGECVGVIGPNGSGKTTLLKILARIFQPTEGLIEIYGHISSLLGIG